MIRLKHVLIISILALLPVTNAYSAVTYGAYVRSGSLFEGTTTVGGAGVASASVSGSVTHSGDASIAGDTYMPVLKAFAELHGSQNSDYRAHTSAEAFQTYTSSTTQSITLDFSLHGITAQDDAPLALAQISANIYVVGGSSFYASETFCHNGQYAFSNYLCGNELGFAQLSTLEAIGEFTKYGSLTFDVIAGEEFAVYGKLSAFARNAVADASNTFNMSFEDATYIQAVGSPVPVPAAAWLFVSGLLGLIGVTRRRR